MLAFGEFFIQISSSMKTLLIFFVDVRNTTEFTMTGGMRIRM